MSEEPKRGPGRPRKPLPFGLEGEAHEVDATPADFDLKAAVLAAVSKQFPDGELSMKLLDESDPKLSYRQLMPQLRVRVLLPKFALATMIPVDGNQEDVEGAMTRLRQDRRRNEVFLEKMIPEPSAAPGTRD